MALVTGAARGVGRATALRLREDGFAVAANDISDDDRLVVLTRQVEGLAVPGDIAAPGAGPAMVERVEGTLGPLDVVVANAAAMEMGPFLEQPAERWWRHLDVNLSGHFRLIQAALPSMRAGGWGRIVILSSGWGVIGHPNATAYAASKAALIALTKSLGRELAPAGILANAIAPSYVDTDQLQVDADDAGVSLDDIRGTYRRLVPTGQLATVDDVAGAVAFLCSEGAASFVGQVLQPAGGVTRTRA